jgi:hypothetical protein
VIKQVGAGFSLTAFAAVDYVRGVEHPPIRLDYSGSPPPEPPVSALAVVGVIAFYIGVIFCLVALIVMFHP